MKRKRIKILITAFEPFGIKGFLGFGNNSMKYMEDLKKIIPISRILKNCRIKYLTMPANAKCFFLLEGARKFKPDIILMLGEDLIQMNDLRIEKFAKSNGIKRSSNFEDKGNSDDAGTYYCNTTYFYALGMTKNALFIHVPGIGYRWHIANKILRILEDIK